MVRQFKSKLLVLAAVVVALVAAEGAAGYWTTTAPGTGSGTAATGSWTISLSPTSGHVGDPVSISGTSFPPSTSVTATYDGTPLTLTPATATNGSGSFSGASFTVPPSAAGAHTVLVSVNSKTATAAFTVTPAIALSPTSGAVGATVTVTGTGFAATSALTATFDGDAGFSLTGAGSSGANGSFSGTFTVPSSTTGAKTVTVADAAANSASTSFAVTAAVATHLAFNVQPSATQAGSAITPAVTVRVLDAGNNVVTSDNSTHVTLAIGTNPSAGTLSGTLTQTASGGVATFTGLSIDKTGTGYTLSASDTTGGGGIHPLTGDTSSTFDITAGAADATQSTLTPASSSITANGSSTQALTVQARDANGNNLSTGGSTVTITRQTGTGTIGSVTDDGNGTYTATVTSPTSIGSGVFVATLGGSQVKSGTGTQTQATVSYTPGAATTLAFQTQPGSATAGSVFGTQPVVVTQDAFGNSSTVGLPATRTVTISITSGTGTLQGTATLDIGTGAGNGSVSFTNLRIDTAGSKTLSVTGTGLGTTASNPFTVSAAAASKLVFQKQPGSATAGSVFGTQPVVVTQDAFGNNSAVGLGASRNVTVAIASGTGTLQGTATLDIGTGAGNGAVTFTNLRIDTAGAKTLSATAAAGSPALTAPTSSSFAVSAAAASTLLFQTQPGSATAGSVFAQQPIVVTQDAFGNSSTVGVGASRNVTVAIASGTGTLQGTATLDIGTGAGNGTVTLTNLRIDTAGAKTLSATAAAGSPTLTAATSSSFTVVAGAPSTAVFTTQPGGGTGGTAWATQPKVTITDAFSNPVSSSPVTLTISTNPGSGTLTCTTNPVSTDGSGVATFAGCAIDTVGTGYRLTATDGSASIASGLFNITVGAAAKLGFTQQPSGSTGGVAFGTQPKVVIQDAGGNTVTGNTSSVTLALTTPAGATLTCTTNPLAAVAGVATFGGCKVDLVGTYTLTATDGALTSAASNSFTITVGTASQFAVSAPTTATAGVALAGITLTAEDAGGNTVAGYTGTHTIAWTGAATSPGGTAPTYPSTSVSFTNGLSTTSLDATLFSAAGPNVLTASATSPSVTGSSASITVSAAAATTMAFVNCSVPGGNTACIGQPISVGNNKDLTFDMQTQDPYGNPSAPSATITITFANSDGTFSITVGAPATITTSGATSGLITLHHGTNGGTTTLTATASSGFTPVTLTAKK